MLKKIVFILTIGLSFTSAQNNAYIIKSNGVLKIGNNFLERIISINTDKAATTEIINKSAGTTYKVKSDEFVLQVVFTGIGPAYSKNQNGENPVDLTSKDFDYTGYSTKDLSDGGKELTLKYNFDYDITKFRLKVCYEIYPNNNFMRKWIEIADSAQGLEFLSKIYLESMRFDIRDFSHGQFGQPVLNKDIFFAVEYPSVENEINGSEARTGYLVGYKIEKTPYVTYTSVLGVAPSKIKLEETFMNYVEGIKVAGTRPYLLYNSWYDFRNPAIVKDTASIMNEKHVLNRIATFKKYMYERYGIALDAFVLDDGWDNYESLWGIDSTRFPNGFTPFLKPLKEMGTSFGIWASPLCGYSKRSVRVNWGYEHGYEKTGDFLCFAGTHYKAAYKKIMTDYTKEYNIGYFKWDGFLLSCNEPDHGHRVGIYSREDLLSTYIEMMEAVRKVNPEIYLNVTTGTWLSPWWLKYADCIWMQGEDYAYAEDVPSINDRDKSITYRDAVLWDDYQKQHLLFPISSLMTHGIIKGRLNFLGGKNESLDSFSNEVMMYFGRGVMMWELYVSPDLLSDAEWEAIASSVKWAKYNKTTLEKTRMILGDPLKRQTYGYIHLTKDKGILLLRNPDVSRRDVKIKLTADLGDLDPGKIYYVKIIYPYNMILKNPVKLNDILNIDLDGYEVLTAELIPADKLDKGIPKGIKYSIEDKYLYTYTGDSKSKIEINENNPGSNDGALFTLKSTVSVPSNCENTKFAYLIFPDKKIEKKIKPKFEIKVNGEKAEVKVEQENGKWFWVISDLKGGENTIECNFNFGFKIKGKISTYVLTDNKLVAKEVSDKEMHKEEILPAKPYPPDIQKEIIPVNNYEIK
jgi:hypothetical protein